MHVTGDYLEILRREVRRVVGLLAERDYDSVVQTCSQSRLTSDDLRNVIHQYGGRIIPPPVDAFVNLDAIRIADLPKPGWSVRVPLYTAEEGRSDLTLELTIILADQGIHIELEDLHVL